MEQKDYNKIEELFRLPKLLSLSEFEDFVFRYVQRKADKQLAIQELDSTIGHLQNHLVSLSLYFKQNYLLDKKTRPDKKAESGFYTKQEIAIKYGVSLRTVTNWIIDGLEVTEIGGIKRISFEAIQKFKESSKGKKFSWKSIARHPHRCD